MTRILIFLSLCMVSANSTGMENNKVDLTEEGKTKEKSGQLPVAPAPGRKILNITDTYTGNITPVDITGMDDSSLMYKIEDTIHRNGHKKLKTAVETGNVQNFYKYFHSIFEHECYDGRLLYRSAATHLLNIAKTKRNTAEIILRAKAEGTSTKEQLSPFVKEVESFKEIELKLENTLKQYKYVEKNYL